MKWKRIKIPVDNTTCILGVKAVVRENHKKKSHLILNTGVCICGNKESRALFVTPSALSSFPRESSHT